MSENIWVTTPITYSKSSFPVIIKHCSKQGVKSSWSVPICQYHYTLCLLPHSNTHTHTVLHHTLLDIFRTSLVAQRLKRLPAMRETWVWSLGWQDPLKEMATHSSILAGRIPWMEEPGRLQSTGSQRVGHDWSTSLSLSKDWSTNYLYNILREPIKFTCKRDLKHVWDMLRLLIL